MELDSSEEVAQNTPLQGAQLDYATDAVIARGVDKAEQLLPDQICKSLIRWICNNLIEK